MYAHQDIEQKWQDFWKKNNVFKTHNPHPTSPGNQGEEQKQKPKYYVLDMFPYPSGAGLHVGHPEGYTANDIVARYKHARGYNVLHPMGWDAFGLPAENYAIKTGVHPKITTAENIATFKRQIQSLGFSYDWSREIDTTDPKYFQWTQWIFLKLFEAGLAYEQDLPINYCPSCKTGLANEEVLSDFTCERCGTKVEKKKIRQWVLAITKYAERLLADVDDLDWPEGIKDMQRNWIGKSEGCEFEMRKAIQGNPIALILHGWDDTENRTNWHWMESLKIELEEIGYDVIMEQLPGNNAPNIEIQLEFLEKYKERLDKNSLVIGHSMGGFLGMHFVASLNKKIGKLICVAPVFNGLINYVDWSNKATGWDIGANSMKKEYDSEKIKNNVEDWHIFLSKNDSGILFEKAKEHFDDIKVSHTDIDNAGHFCERDGYKHFSQLFDYIKDSIRVYTTRIDTVFGMTYAVIAPDHPQVGDFITAENKEACESYIKTASQQSDQDRTADDKEKTGVFTGSYVINPYNGEQVPLWIADYVLGSYGTGAVMAVPAHDERDFEFAKKFGLEIKQSIGTEFVIEVGINESFYEYEYDEKIQVYIIKGDLRKSITGYGKLINSGTFTGLTSQEAKEQLTAHAEKNGFGHKKINYKLRDWLFSRQRYWGEPIPLIHLETSDVEKLPTSPSPEAWVKDGNILMLGEKEFSKIYDGIYGKIVCDYRLPLELPQVEAYEPAGDGQSPLAKVPEFVHVQLAENLHGKRETNTMPQWGGSCWYYLRFMDAKNPEELVSKDAENYWGSVDSYVGGAEHAVLHLLYARFWHKFLYDIGVVSTIEPFHRLRNQGMILAYAYQRANGGLLANDLVEERDGRFYEISTKEEVKRVVAKMSKSLKNVVNPDDIVKQFGADTLRLYEMYMGDFADTKPWDTTAIVGCRRFLDRVHALFLDGKEKFAETDEKAMKTLHKAIKKITEDIENYKFNTAIAQMMICINEGLPKDAGKKAQWKESFLKLLHPFAPHLAEECWEKLSSPYKMYSKIYFATENTSKIDRAQKLFSRIHQDVKIEKFPEIIDVVETGKTSLECALQKIEVYKEKNIDAPIAVADTSIHFHNVNFDFEPTKVKRTALERVGKKEGEISQEEIAELMIAFYQEKARENGGSIDYHYIDSWAVLYPNGEVKTIEYRREYTLTDERRGELMPYFPMNSLYVSKYTGKRHHESTDDDFHIEHAGQAEAFRELFGLGKNSIFFADWPSYDEALTVDNELTIGVQVLGKLRGEVHVSVDESQDSVLEKAKSNPDVAKWLEGKEIVKEIYVPGKIVNIVVK